MNSVRFSSVVMLLTIMGLILIELGMAAFFPAPYFSETNMYFIADPYTGYRLKPNSRGQYYHGIEAVANSQGHRDDEVLLPKPVNTFRILVLGDSFAVGANVEQSEAFPQVLEELLNGSKGAKVEVVNAGVGGWAIYQYAEYLEHYGRDYEPDLVLISATIGSDIYLNLFTQEKLLTAIMGRRVSRKSAARSYIGLQIFLYENSHFYRRLITGNRMLKTNIRRVDCTDFLDGYIGLQGERVRVHTHPDDYMLELADKNIALMRDMAATAKGFGAKTVVALIPDENQINPALQKEVLRNRNREDYDFGMPQSYLKGRLEDAEIPVIDLLPEFLQQDECFYMNDGHWAPVGHELAAVTISEAIQSMGLISE
jgi:hypothetical protein